MHDATACFGSVDWALQSHTACIVDGSGLIVDQFTTRHTAAGLTTLVLRFQCERVCRVAIERPDGPVVEALMAAGLEVVVVSGRTMKSLRTRYGQAGNKADRSDAYVLADCLRTDGHRWPAVQAATHATVALRAAVRARKDLVSTRVATANQLRACPKAGTTPVYHNASPLNAAAGAGSLSRRLTAAKVASAPTGAREDMTQLMRGARRSR